MANIVIFTLGRELDANGNPAGGALATFYESGTTTLLTVYSDSSLSTAHENPVVADSGGLFPAVYTSGDSVKVVITKASGAALRTIDPCPIVSGDVTGAASVAFSPTVDLPYDNVQDAVEGAAASAASGFAPYGLGVTGNAPDLANLDATNIGTGFYRTTGSTTGTFPTGITASSTSIVRVERETASLSYQQLMDDSGKIFQRWYSGGSWGAWTRGMLVPQGASTGDLAYYTSTGLFDRLAIGSTDQILTVSSGLPAWASVASESSSSTASGTSVTAAWPSWANSCEIGFLGVVASNGAYVQLGTSGPTWVTSGYVATYDREGGSGQTTSGIIYIEGGTFYGQGRVTRYADNTLTGSGNVRTDTTVVNAIGGTSAAISGLAHIRVVTISGSFAGGTVKFRFIR